MWFRRLNRVSVGFLSACGVIWARIAKLGSRIGSGAKIGERGRLGFRDELRLQFRFLIKCSSVTQKDAGDVHVFYFELEY